MEASELGIFMISACVFTVLLEYPASPLRQSIPSALLRNALIGLAMGLTLISLVYSPWGKQSGAHMNPAFTLTFFRLGKLEPWDAFFYVIAQFVGGVAGVSISWLLMGMVLADRSVSFAVTHPGALGAKVAFFAEVAISFVLILTVLTVSNSRRWSRYTGLFAGTLVATYITFEAPLSGMSMNPARTFGSAFVVFRQPLALLRGAFYRNASRSGTVCETALHPSRSLREISSQQHQAMYLSLPVWRTRESQDFGDDRIRANLSQKRQS
jgi:aquaporin Z